MKREISGTSVATAVLLLAAAALMCIRMQRLETDGAPLPLYAALLLEAAFYSAVVALACRRLSLRAEALGVPALFAMRIGVSAVAAASVHLGASGHWPAAVDFLAPGWAAWVTAGAFSAAALSMVGGMMLQSAQATRGQSARGPVAALAPAKVAFESERPQQAPGVAPRPTTEPAEAAPTTFQVLEPLPAATPAVVLPPPPPQVEGWITLPASALRAQLPPGAEVEGESLVIPLSLIVPRLREGQVRIPLEELRGIISLPPDGEETAQVELPLPLVVQQLPDEVLELPESTPPSWLAVDAGLEEVLFAKV